MLIVLSKVNRGKLRIGLVTKAIFMNVFVGAKIKLINSPLLELPIQALCPSKILNR